MSKINLNLPLLDVEGKEVGQNLNKLLANILMTGSSNDPIKLFEMALKLMTDGVLELDTADKELLILFIKNSETLTILGKGRLLEVIK